MPIATISTGCRALLPFAFGLVTLAGCGSLGPASSESAACTAQPAPDPAITQAIEPQGLDQWLFDEAVLHAVNTQRCRRGLIPLAADLALARAASYHSGDMVAHDFFDHASPVSGRATLGDRFAQVGAPFTSAAENIATLSLYAFGGRHYNVRDAARCDFTFTQGGPSIPRHSYASAAEALVEGWMDSPGHRRNVLHPGMTRHGAGVALKPDSQVCGTMIAVQVFAG